MLLPYRRRRRAIFKNPSFFSALLNANTREPKTQWYAGTELGQNWYHLSETIAEPFRFCILKSRATMNTGQHYS